MKASISINVGQQVEEAPIYTCLHKGPACKPLLLMGSCRTTTQACGEYQYSVLDKTTGKYKPKAIGQPDCSEVYRSNYGAVDLHNRYRTGDTAMHDIWKCKGM